MSFKIISPDAHFNELSNGMFWMTWPRWNGIQALGFLFAFNGHRHTGSAILNVAQVRRVA
jgi:hypothetical protein